ncbi:MULTISPECIES: hypothetical protein [unclassified Bradyrhizobium]|uniref:hypothetical protein n=1 Tax=unclassified Bradyrhizobium TaxID=2631580 RepID=UPI001BAD75FC|nr:MULTISPECIES: hypothetical protein [unclassified Bradyrhizobium]MBR1205916.1 hypothetical protein [Bradyrhizobium sp. AUGA SZCCT0124]MBR1315695.1 hypothetical protein [Bradyrhizobium sp. AUGA SZCCT0051]MBR1338243.1 hypothetical protein [Bradyrhizobium sp. AUGA SZCCT0105]MBR1355898.1 hypothetical protein [Bradyrhizobium sp. AUGA SZCCT0045]
MLSRALSLATVTLLIGCLSAVSAQAQNLEAGKSPSQIFANTCTACHKSPRGLLKTVPAGSLPGFLRQHYTTSSDMAGVLASYLISNGANDPRYQAKDQPKGAKGRDGRQEANQSPEQPAERPSRRQHQGAAPQEGAKEGVREAAKPDADGLNPEARPAHRGRRMARPSETPDGAKPDDGQTPQAAGEGKPARRKHGRRGKPVEEPKSDEAPKSEAAGDEPKSQTAVKREDKGEAEKPAKPAGQPDTAKVDAPKGNAGSEPAAVRSDPVPQVTPAAPAASPAPEPAAAASPAPVPAAPPVTAAAPPPPPPTTPGSGPPEAPTSK